MMPLTEATKAVVLEALEAMLQNHEAFWATWAAENMRPSEHRDRLRNAITELKAASAAGEWKPVSEKFILTHDTGLVNQPKLFVRWNADDECVLVGKDDGSFYHCPLPPHIRLCEYIGSQEDTQDGTNEQ